MSEYIWCPNVCSHYQGFRQDQMFASHMFWMSTVKPKPVYIPEMCLMTWHGLQTHMWHHLHSHLRHNSYLIVLLLKFVYRPPIFLHIHTSTTGFTRPNDGWMGHCKKLRHLFVSLFIYWHWCTDEMVQIVVLFSWCQSLVTFSFPSYNNRSFQTFSQYINFVQYINNLRAKCNNLKLKSVFFYKLKHGRLRIGIPHVYH